MTHDPLLTAVLFGCFLALGIGAEHMRIRWAMHRKRRRRVLGASYRPAPMPVTARWTPAHGEKGWR